MIYAEIDAGNQRRTRLSVHAECVHRTAEEKTRRWVSYCRSSSTRGERRLFCQASQNLEIHGKDRGVRRDFLKDVDGAFEKCRERLLRQQCGLWKMIRKFGIEDGSEDKHVSKLTVHA